MLTENIRILRKNKGMTQEELAIRLNVVRQTVSKWEKGLSVPDAVLLEKLAEVLETDVSTLLGETVEPETDSNGIAEQLSRINEQIAVKNNRSRKVWIIVGIIVIAAISIILSLLLLSIIRIPLSYRFGSEEKLSEQNDNGAVSLITDFDSESPYVHYRDLVLSDNHTGYEIHTNEADGFRFYFAESKYDVYDEAVFYPKYICYISYDNTFPEDTDMTIKYVYDRNNNWESSGEAEHEVMLLGDTLTKLPCEIIITVRERGEKAEQGDVIANASFKIYSAD